MSDPNIGFVIAAYVVAFVIIVSMIVVTIADHASLKKSLSKLAARTGSAANDRDEPT